MNTVSFVKIYGTIYMFHNGINIGKSLIEEEEPAIYIRILKIKKRYRNKGYGFLMLNYLVNNSSNHESISLYVSVLNKVAIKLYRKCGFFISLLTSKNKESPHYLMTKKL